MAKNKYADYGDYAPEVGVPEQLGEQAAGAKAGETRPGAGAPEPGAAIVGGGLLLAAAIVAAAAVGLMGLWLIGEVVSDRFFVTQFLEWMPTKLVLLGAMLLLIGARICLTLGSVMRRPSTTLRRLIAAGWIALFALLLYYVFVEAPIFRAKPASPSAGDDAFRVVFWNMSSEKEPGWETSLAAEAGDIVVIPGAADGANLATLANTMNLDTLSVVSASPFTILSKRPVTRWGLTRLNLRGGEGWDPRVPEGRKVQSYPGYAMFFEVQCPAKGATPAAPLVVWVIDMPSDLSLSRWQVTREAREAIDGFRGVVWVPGPGGRWFEGEPATDKARGFPKPDLIVGDFNIPRGSASLAALNEGYPSAYSQAGKGEMSSFPTVALVHIDQTFVGPALRAWRYAIKSVGAAPHHMQIVELARPAPKTK